MICVEVAEAMHGRDRLIHAVGRGEIERLVHPWRFPDRCPMPRLRLFRRRP